MLRGLCEPKAESPAPPLQDWGGLRVVRGCELGLQALK